MASAHGDAPTEGGGGRAKQPIFYFDLASPVAYLAAERVNHVLGEVPEGMPVRVGEPAPSRCHEGGPAHREDVERAAARQGVQPLRWPEPFPGDSEWAMLVATY